MYAIFAILCIYYSSFPGKINIKTLQIVLSFLL